MRPQILLTVSPSDGRPRAVLDVFDLDQPKGSQTVWSMAAFLDRPVESRPEWAKTYAHYVLHELAQFVAEELDRGRDVQVLPAIPGELEDLAGPDIRTSERWTG